MTDTGTPARDVRGWAQRYIDAGLHPLPLKFAEKELRDSDGLKRTYTADEFNETDNIGLQLGGGFVAVDFDAEEITARMIVTFMPGTCGWGRKSKHTSQLLYRANFGKSVIFKDLGAEDKKKATLVEIRATHQSMVPPSVHPNGEDVVWQGQLPPSDVEVAALHRAARLVSTCALLVRYYPPSGARHHWGLNLAGFLRYLEIKSEECVQLVTVAGACVGDGEVKDRLDAIRSTFSRSEDDPIGGAKLLAENMDADRGPKFIAAMRAIWGDAGRTAREIERLNTKHAVVFSQGGSVTVMTEDDDGNMRFTRAIDFKLLYPEPVLVGANKAGDPVTKPLGETWLTHPDRRMYWGIELAPNGKARDKWYNTWKGFKVEPKQGDWSLYREHLRTVVGYSEEVERWLLGWMALTVRHPDQPVGTCVAFRGSQGTGKSTFCKWFGALFGRHFVHLDSEQRLLGHFNAHLERAIVILADEAVWAGGKQGLGALKRMITEETLAIERKFMDPVMVPNMLHIMVASNEDWVVPKAIDDRRFLVVNASTRYQNNKEKFFSRVAKQLEEGGWAALLHELLNNDALLDGFNVHMPPRTEEGRRQQELSLDPIHAWWKDELEEGFYWSKRDIIGIDEHSLKPEKGAKLLQCEHFAVPRDRVMARYESFLGNVRYTYTKNQVGIFLGEVLPPGYPATMRIKRERMWVLPSWAACREFWLKLYPQGHLAPQDDGHTTDQKPL